MYSDASIEEKMVLDNLDCSKFEHTDFPSWPDSGRAEELTRLLKELAAAAVPYITAPKPVRQPASGSSGGCHQGVGLTGARKRHDTRR